MQIADAEGFEAVSMRRIALELDAGTMSLYHYVGNRQELLSLMSDLVMAELVVPDNEVAEDWREALSTLARRIREAFKRHPWIFHSMSAPKQVGPSGLMHFEQSMAAVSELGIPSRERLELIALVDDYVFGFSLRELLSEAAGSHRVMDEPALHSTKRRIESAEYPHDCRFERGLKMLFDGFERSRQEGKKRRPRAGQEELGLAADSRPSGRRP